MEENRSERGASSCIPYSAQYSTAKDGEDLCVCIRRRKRERRVSPPLGTRGWGGAIRPPANISYSGAFALTGYNIPSRARFRGRARLEDARLQALGKIVESNLFTIDDR